MPRILTAEDVVRRIAGECAFVDERIAIYTLSPFDPKRSLARPCDLGADAPSGHFRVAMRRPIKVVSRPDSEGSAGLDGLAAWHLRRVIHRDRAAVGALGDRGSTIVVTRPVWTS
jgi:hypothetical protein